MHYNSVSDQIGTGFPTDQIIDVMNSVPRHEFVPPELQVFAYMDQPLPIGYGKTISQPFIVALMTDLLDIRAKDSILEVGTGLGYHTAVLANLAKTVYSVEIIQELAHDAESKLSEQGYTNVELKIGDGSYGWPEHSPFDKIIVTAAPELIPASLLNQLKPGGKMVLPAGIKDAQQLMLVDKDAKGSLKIKEVLGVIFTPLITTH